MSSRGITKKLCIMVLVAGAVAAMAACTGAAKDESGKETEISAESGTEAAPAAAYADTKAGASLAVTEPAAAPESTGTSQPEQSAPEPAVRVLTGKLTDVGTGTVTIVSDRYPEGITFSEEGASVNFMSGLGLDSEITIFYQGEISSGNTSNTAVQLIRDKRDKDEECQAAMVSGKVLSIGMSVVTIETADGVSISFEQDPKPLNMTDGPEEGDTVTILYSYRDEGGDGAVVPELIR